MKRTWYGLGVLMGLLLAAPALQAQNLVKNGDFTQGTTGWSVATSEQKITQDKPDDKPGALKVEIVKDGGKSLGEVRQTIKVKKNQKYRLVGEMKSTKPGVGLLMVKPRADRKELARIATDTSGAQWKTVSKEFDSGEATEVQVLCRFNQRESMVGAICWFTNIQLEAIADAPAAKPAAP